MRERTSKWTLISGKSSKFYHVELFTTDGGTTWTCQGRHGRIGSKGKVVPKASGVSHNSAAVAFLEECDARRRKGYDEQGEVLGDDFLTPQELSENAIEDVRLAAKAAEAQQARNLRALSARPITPRPQAGPVHFI